MRFEKRDHSTRLERNDRDMHIVAQICRVNETRGGPFSVGFRHDRRCDIILIGNNNLGMIKPRYSLVRLAHPVETQHLVTCVMKRPRGARGQVGVATLNQSVLRAIDLQRGCALDHKQNALRALIRFRLIRSTTW